MASEFCYWASEFSYLLAQWASEVFQIKRSKNQLCDYKTTEPALMLARSQAEIFQVITLAGWPGESNK